MTVEPQIHGGNQERERERYGGGNFKEKAMAEYDVMRRGGTK